MDDELLAAQASAGVARAASAAQGASSRTLGTMGSLGALGGSGLAQEQAAAGSSLPSERSSPRAPALVQDGGEEASGGEAGVLPGAPAGDTVQAPQASPGSAMVLPLPPPRLVPGRVHSAPEVEPAPEVPPAQPLASPSGTAARPPVRAARAASAALPLVAARAIRPASASAASPLRNASAPVLTHGNAAAAPAAGSVNEVEEEEEEEDGTDGVLSLVVQAASARAASGEGPLAAAWLSVGETAAQVQALLGQVRAERELVRLQLALGEQVQALTREQRRSQQRDREGSGLGLSETLRWRQRAATVQRVATQLVELLASGAWLQRGALSALFAQLHGGGDGAGAAGPRQGGRASPEARSPRAPPAPPAALAGLMHGELGVAGLPSPSITSRSKALAIPAQPPPAARQTERQAAIAAAAGAAAAAAAAAATAAAAAAAARSGAAQPPVLPNDDHPAVPETWKERLDSTRRLMVSEPVKQTADVTAGGVADGAGASNHSAAETAAGAVAAADHHTADLESQQPATAAALRQTSGRRMSPVGAPPAVTSPNGRVGPSSGPASHLLVMEEQMPSLSHRAAAHALLPPMPVVQPGPQGNEQERRDFVTSYERALQQLLLGAEAHGHLAADQAVQGAHANAASREPVSRALTSQPPVAVTAAARHPVVLPYEAALQQLSAAASPQERSGLDRAVRQARAQDARAGGHRTGAAASPTPAATVPAAAAAAAAAPRRRVKARQRAQASAVAAAAVPQLLSDPATDVAGSSNISKKKTVRKPKKQRREGGDSPASRYLMPSAP